MASRIGLSYRNEAAKARMSRVLGDLTAQMSVEIPAEPAGRRDAGLDATVRMEWMADVLEHVASGNSTQQRELEELAERIRELEATLAEQEREGENGSKAKRAVKRDG